MWPRPRPISGQRVGLSRPRPGAAPGCAEQRFELREPEFDGIEIGTVRGQIEERGAGPRNAFADALDLMRGQVVHDDEVTRPECRDEHLIERREKAVAIHRPVEETGRGQTVHTEGRDKRVVCQ